MFEPGGARFGEEGEREEEREGDAQRGVEIFYIIVKEKLTREKYEE